MCYAKRFYSVFESMNAQDLSKLSPYVKAHAMNALASLMRSMGLAKRANVSSIPVALRNLLLKQWF